MSEPELKRCPFCSDVASLGNTEPAPAFAYMQANMYCPPGPSGRHFVLCGGCGVQTDTFRTAVQAVNAWNRRA